MNFDSVIILDWSAAAKPTRGKDSIWIGQAGAGAAAPVNPATRAEAMALLRGRIAAARAKGLRVLVGADFPFGYPQGFAAALTGQDRALALWGWLMGQVQDAPDNANNRFDLAARINAQLPGVGPFWGRPSGLDLPDLPEKGSLRADMPFAERRVVEAQEPKAQPVWKLFTTGSVGSQALLGIAHLARLRADLGADCAVWPFEPSGAAGVVLAEVWPSLLAEQVAAAEGLYPCKDAAQVDLLAKALAGMAPGDLAGLMAPDAAAGVLAEEGWILGAGKADALRAGLAGDLPALTPPRLRNDCFAMPQGVDWVPVDEALARLRSVLVPLARTETLPVAQAGGRVLAADAVALRSNPPRANAAVDGYGFARHALTGEGPWTLPLVPGRAAAGQPFDGAVPAGQAIRILTGAILPQGVDTVVLEEDCATDAARVAFDGPVKPGINTRRAGEDVAEGQVALRKGRVLTPPDLALLSALGLAQVQVHAPLRVGVLSTGDEIIATPGDPALPHQIHDANRPMLLELIRRWGFDPVDLGHVADDPRKIAARLDKGARLADVMLTSGGASAGDEDHVSHLLRTRGSLSSWRIAMKPGRPLALALWRGVPVLGLPGNPVAALVCALIFGRPALALMAGADWPQPAAFTVPAAFAKRKKAGRREYLRARINTMGQAEVFASEGSGRISGLSWAEGLVELPDGAAEITPGSAVRFLPFGF
ncbi:molybdopterin-binding protein [Pseudotabrizicola sp. L79]|uniref:molybdopterin-binding protein n=1 Tax=Pseudotabrizicola sp. L79 TaxID=3118402 RepID=UPI002F939172